MIFNSKYELISMPIPSDDSLVVLKFDEQLTTPEEAYETFLAVKKLLPENTLVMCMSTAFEIERASIEDLIQMRNTCDALLKDYAAGRIE